MVDVIQQLRHAASGLWEAGKETSREIKTGVLTAFSSDGAYMVRNFYSLDGFEKLTRVGLSYITFLSLNPAKKKIFAECRATIDAQKDLYHASMVFRSFAPFVKYKKEDLHKRNPIGFQIPMIQLKRGAPETIDWYLLALCIASLLDVAQFFKKHQLIKTWGLYSKYIPPLGVRHMGPYQLNQIPVIQALFDERPKEIFVVIASGIDIWRNWYVLKTPHNERGDDWSMKKWEAILQIVSKAGTIVGLGLYRCYKGHPWLAVAGLIGSHAGVLKFMLSEHHKRLKRNDSLWQK